MMKTAASLMALAGILWSLPASARAFVQDQAGMFSSGTVAALNTRIGNFNAQTGKEIVVVTVPSLGGATLQSAAQAAFAQQNVNGVLIFIARDDRRDIIVPDRAGVQAGWFTPDVLRGIRTSMEALFRSENYDAGITAAVSGVLNVYRAHVNSLRAPNSSAAGAPMASSAGSATGGFHLSMFWWIIIAVIGFLLVRSILRAMAAPRYYPPAAGGAPGTPGAPGAPGAPAPGYGPGYGYGGFGGGGSFWSGLLGGLGGAWLGNEMFGQRGGMMGGPAQGQLGAGDPGGGWGGGAGGADAGWQNDAGQADMGGASGGDWSGGGFGDGGGGFGGGDFGGGGDTGGGW
jgi:uncharacterized membrane protein YgcG